MRVLVPSLFRVYLRGTLEKTNVIAGKLPKCPATAKESCSVFEFSWAMMGEIEGLMVSLARVYLFVFFAGSLLVQSRDWETHWLRVQAGFAKPLAI